MQEFRLDFDVNGVRGGVYADDCLAAGVVRPVQTHSCNIGVIERDGIIGIFEDTDALICFKERVKIGVRTADCVPVMVYCPDLRAVAAIHAGWKGSIGEITRKTLERLREAGADLSRAEAAFGPCICGDCYEISEELAERFRLAGYGDCFKSARHLDLEAVNKKQLLAAGLKEEKIHRKPCCTFESAGDSIGERIIENIILPSWRRKSTDFRLLTWIQLL